MTSKKDLLRTLSHRDTQDTQTGTQQRNGNRRRLLVGLLAVVTCVSVAGFSNVLTRSRGEAEATRVAAETAAGFPAIRTSVQRIEVAGFVTAPRTATVSAKTIGVVQSILVDEGDRVEKNQAIAKLDDTRARIDYEQAVATAKLSATRVTQAEVALDEAGRVLQRQRALVAAQFSSSAVLSSAETDLKLKQVALDSARLESEVSRIDVARQQVLLNEYTIRAPFAGVVLALNAQQGETIAPSSAGGSFTRTGICTIADVKSLEIEVDINEQVVDQIKPKQRIRAVAAGKEANIVFGEVFKLEPAADRAKATVRLRIRIKPNEAKLLPGMSVRVTFLDKGDST
jgi:RND family efflux transporter MFP subunit